MAINVATSFNVQTNLPIDKRFKFETIEEMKGMNANLLYEGVLSYNMETSKYYTYSKNNSEEEILGKWREFSSGSDICYFNSWEEWESARIAGELDPDKYYAYPTYGITDAPKPVIKLPEAEMKVEFSDGSIKNYTIYCKEE